MQSDTNVFSLFCRCPSPSPRCTPEERQAQTRVCLLKPRLLIIVLCHVGFVRCASCGARACKPVVRRLHHAFNTPTIVAPRSDAKAPNSIDVYGFTAIISYFFRLARSHPVDHALAMRLFLAFDANNDQFVDFDEFIQ